MKRLFLLLCVICVLYGLSWGDFGKSTEGTFSTVTFTHTTNCDSAWVYFGYPSSNLYYSLKLFPLPADNRKLLRDSLDLDSVGGHYGEVRYYEQGAGSVSGYVIGEWVHENPTPGDTIQRNASTHGASDVAALWGDTLNQLLITVDSVITAMGYDADSTLLTFLRYVRNNQVDYKATGFSTFDPSTDTVVWVDTVLYAGEAQKNTEEEIKEWVWYADSVTYFDSSGTMGSGNVLQGEAAGLTADQVVTEFEDRGYGYGSGVFACTVYTKLFSDSSVIPNIHVIVKNTDQTQLLANGYTNANGWVVLGLDSIADGALHKFWLMNIEYSFDFPESADINTDTSVTFYGTAFDYGDPPPENQCAVYDQVFDLALDSLSGVLITTELRVPKDSILRYEDFPISPYRLTYTTGVSGRWRFNLIPNEDLLPLNTWYLFKFKFPTGVEGRYFIYEDSTIVPKQESARYKAISGRM